MEFVKAHLVRSQADVDAILAINPDHWIGEALEADDVDTLFDHAVILFGDNYEPIVKDSTELVNQNKITEIQHVSLPFYMQHSLYVKQAEVTAYSTEKDPDGICWIPSSDDLIDQGLI